MRNYIWSFLMFFCFTSVSFSQTGTIEKGTYISGNKGQKIKLNLLEDNKYELVFYSGEYKVKGDSLIFANKDKSESGFDLSFLVDKKAKKIKIKFLDPSYYSFYIGTQKGNETVQYQRVSDIKTKVDPEWLKTDLEFDIEKTDFLYLVYEDYNGQSNVFKYALPKDVSEVAVSYEPALLTDLKIAGLFDRKTNELKISEQSGRDPLVFVNEKDVKPEKTSKVKPLENQTVLNWTYPGKEPFITEDFGSGVAADTTAIAPPATDAYVSKQIDFKLKIEDNLKNALTATKMAKTKFLAVAFEDKNPSAKTDFDAFVKNQETQISYSMYDTYNPQYDLFNYYLTTADDKKWLKTNKITNSPSVLVLNGNGDILATAKSNLTDKQYQFGYYDGVYKKLQRADGLLTFDKTIKNKKTSDTDLIMAFNKIAVLEIPYDYETDATSTDVTSTEFKFVNTTLDKKEVAQIWKKLIEAHQKDTKPNMYLVETILKEIKNQGFTKQIDNEDRILNDTDFLSIDYFLKHSDAIEENRLAFNSTEGETHTLGNVISEISSALQQNSYVVQNKAPEAVNQAKIAELYKKIIASGKANFELYRSYFNLGQIEDKNGSDISFLKEFDTYFNSNLGSKTGNPIERLDAIYSSLDSNSDFAYDGWNAFKEYHSNLCNSVAWTVVLKAENSDFIKRAITWSEYSLVITKNNPYYLDTLAQLYYKDGQKDKAIQTQTLAVKYLNADVEEETAGEIRATLNKMQNGMY
ncbi:hypothetical protein [Flavobacterium chilense]|uniref:Thioredoxin-like n=1 Tax=Flavobacterium chilense TaxID=946677 RepID=A0A1M7MRV8_9FLAO|nr:hypothetical protein [Flavobacterium chilense]SHM93813.1 hypothetical protein SAMN05444484_1146 [Flavobacterium chilense]